MSARKPIILAPLLCPAFHAQGETPPQDYDYSFQLYQEDDDRMRIESHYVRGNIEINDETSFRFQALSDAISGASPTGVLPGNVQQSGPPGAPDSMSGASPSVGVPGSVQPFIGEVADDTRLGILAALSRQFGDHRVELELSRSDESDYLSDGIAITDDWELNQKNTTLSFGFNYLNDLVTVPDDGDYRKNTYDWFAGVSQVIDKNTVVSANLTLGYSEGYLNDPYKYVQRTETIRSPDGTPVQAVTGYRENRPHNRFRQVLQFEGRHYVAAADGALDGIFRLSTDDFGVFSQMLRLEWRQAVGERFEVVPFFRYYHQNAADFFVRSLDGLSISDPANPTSDDPNWSADYRLSSFNAFSGGLQLRYRFNEMFSANACYERYVMSATGSYADRSPDESYPSANVFTVGLSADF
jgi:hypothetical protein